MPEKKQQEQEIEVKLKPFLGIRPGVYLFIIYSIILFAVIFFLLIFPGLRNPNAALIVTTSPTGAAVRVNDVYMGLSGSRIIIPRGTHTIKVVMPGFESYTSVHQIPSRVFGSSFFPRRYRIDVTLETADPAAAFALKAADFAAWTFGGEATETWQVPLSLSEGVYRIGAQDFDREQINQMLLAASRFAVTRAAKRDLIRAKALLDNNGNAPSPASLLNSISDTLAFLSQNPGSAAWLSRILPNKAAIRNSAWINSEFDTQTAFFPGNEANLSQPTLPARFELAGLAFSRMDEGRLLARGRAFDNTVFINRFMISETPVPRSLFQTFLNENPEWQGHQVDYFPDEIAMYPLDAPARDVITGITWYAAAAFCRWLTARLPPIMAGLEVRLPTEYEWEYAALSIANMNNPSWEWCADPFAPLQFITAPAEAVWAVGSPERSLRGRPSAFLPQTRASLPPEFSSPFVTFRPVIARHGTHW